MLRDFYLGLLKVHILFHACEKPVYGAALMEELNRHGYQIGPGTLYPILHGLEKEDLIKSFRSTVDGKVRRYYQSTEKGSAALQEARLKIRELVNEILEEKL